jgi:hypothetical protein
MYNNTNKLSRIELAQTIFLKKIYEEKERIIFSSFAGSTFLTVSFYLVGEGTRE